MKKLLKISICFGLAMLVSHNLIGQSWKNNDSDNKVDIISKHVTCKLKSGKTDLIRLDSMVFLRYDTVSGTWKYSSARSFKFTADNKLVTENKYKYYTSSSTFSLTWKRELKYDAAGNNIEEIRYSLNSAETALIPTYKFIRTFDSNQNILLEDEYGYNEPDNWSLHYNYKNEYTYNSNIDVTSQIIYSYDSGLSSWIPSSKFEINFSLSGLRTDEIEYRYDNSDIVPYYKKEYLYDLNGNLLKRAHSGYNSVDKVWLSKDRYEMIVDNSNNMVTELHFDTDSSKYKTEYSFDNSVTFNQMKLPFDDWDMKFIFNHKVASYVGSRYITEKSSWLASDKCDFFYNSPTPSFTDNKHKVNLNIYPNPASNFILIKGIDSNKPASLKISDIQGKIILQQTEISDQAIGISHLDEGLYIYCISMDGIEYKGKFIKQ